jgi:Fe-S cluster assembly iron-binding protein IscA
MAQNYKVKFIQNEKYKEYILEKDGVSLVIDEHSFD